MKEISIRLFGPFRDFSARSEISLSLDKPEMTAAEVRVSLLSLLKELPRPEASRRPQGSDLAELIAQSALADERQVLKPNDRVRGGMRLAILPPVCGG